MPGTSSDRPGIAGRATFTRKLRLAASDAGTTSSTTPRASSSSAGKRSATSSPTVTRA